MESVFVCIKCGKRVYFSHHHKVRTVERVFCHHCLTYQSLIRPHTRKKPALMKK